MSNSTSSGCPATDDDDDEPAAPPSSTAAGINTHLHIGPVLVISAFNAFASNESAREAMVYKQRKYNDNNNNTNNNNNEKF
jgi:hypothetical protein